MEYCLSVAQKLGSTAGHGQRRNYAEARMEKTSGTKSKTEADAMPASVCKADAYLPSAFLRNLIPFVAISFVVGSMRRQMAAARAMTFTSVVKLSITTSPL